MTSTPIIHTPARSCPMCGVNQDTIDEMLAEPQDSDDHQLAVKMRSRCENVCYPQIPVELDNWLESAYEDRFEEVE